MKPNVTPLFADRHSWRELLSRHNQWQCLDKGAISQLVPPRVGRITQPGKAPWCRLLGLAKEVKKGGEAAPNFKGGLLLRLHKTAAKHGEGANQQRAQPLLPLSLPLPTINRNPGLPHVVDALHMRTQICVTICLTGASLGT